MGKKKSLFYGCSAYPTCDFSSWDMPTKEKCPKCGGMLFLKKSKNQLVCHLESCGYSVAAPEKETENDENKSEEA
jgi:DNA topoisomerase-1